MRTKEEAIKIIKTIKISFGDKQEHTDNVKPYNLYDLLKSLEQKAFDADISSYHDAKKLSAQKVNKNEFLPCFLPHAVMTGKRKLTNNSGKFDHSRWAVSGLVHADLDNIESGEFDSIWDKLKTTKPLFLFRSPNGGIKCFWLTNINNSLENREMFMHLARYIVKSLLTKANIDAKFYDPAPMNANSKCYVSGGPEFKIEISPSFQVIDIEPFKNAILRIFKDKKNLEAKRTRLLEKAANDGDIQSWANLSDKQRINYESWATNKLAKEASASKNKGNSTSFRYACYLLSECKMDEHTALEYMSKLKHSIGARATFDPKKQLEAAFKTTNCNNLGGVVKTEIFSSLVQKTEDEISGLNRKLSAITRNTIDTKATTEKEEWAKILASKPKELDAVTAVEDDDPELITIEEADKSPLKLKDLSALSVSIITGLPSSGKSYKMCRDSVGWMLAGDITIYVAPDRQSIKKTVADSRFQEVEKCLKDMLSAGKIIKDQFDFYMKNVHTIFSADKDSGSKKQMVSIQFDNALGDITAAGKGGIILMTMAGMMTVDLSGIDAKKTRIVFDDINDLPSVMSLGTWQSTEKNRLLNYIDVDTTGSCHKVKGITLEGLKYIDAEKSKGDRHPMYERIESARKKSRTNKSTYYTTELRPDGGYDVSVVSMLNLDILSSFKEIYFAGDQVEYNPYVLLLAKKCGVKINNIKLPSRTNRLQDRVKKIYYLTEHNFGKSRTERQQELPNQIAVAIKAKFGNSSHKNALICLNNDQKDLGIFKEELKDDFDLTVASANTKGLNHLKENTLILNAFKCDLPVSMKHVLSNITGLSFDEIEIFIHRNLLMQNLFRGCLRHKDDPRICDYVAPSKKDAEFIKERLLSEAGVNVEIECLDNKVSDYYKPLLAGRISKMGVAMTTAQRTQLKGLRKQFGDKVDDIDIQILLSEMKGLRGENRTAKFNKLLSNVEKSNIVTIPIKKKTISGKSPDTGDLFNFDETPKNTDNVIDFQALKKELGIKPLDTSRFKFG